MLNKKDILGFETLFSNLQEYKDLVYVFVYDNSDESFRLLTHFDFPMKGIVLSDEIFYQNYPSKNLRTLDVPVYSISDFLQNYASQSILIIIGSKIELEPKNFYFNLGNVKIEIPTIEISRELMRGVADKRTADYALNVQNNLGVYDIDDFMNHFIHGLYYGYNIEPILYTQPKEIFRPMPKFNFNDVAIVMQGPVRYEGDFTLKTLHWYRRLYPEIPIILSTWKDEVTPEFKQAAESAKIYILENDKPKNPGGEHINFQLASSMSGVQYAKKDPNVRYILKTRTDQKFYKMDFLRHFKNLLKVHPPKDGKLKCRLIFSSLSYTLWPFFLCDMFVFGSVDDIEKLYSIPFMTNEGEYHYRHKGRFGKICLILNKIAENDLETLYKSKKLQRLMRYLNKFYFPEAYAFRTFFEEHIRPIDPKNLLRDYWDFLSDYLVIVDMRDLMFFWPKYYWCEFKARSFYDSTVLEPTMDHSRWLDLKLLNKNFKNQ